LQQAQPCSYSSKGHANNEALRALIATGTALQLQQQGAHK